MVNLASKNLLIIHGGRTSQNVKSQEKSDLIEFLKGDHFERKDSNSPSPHLESFTLSDMWALRLDTLEWIRVVINDEAKLIRTNHCLAKVSEDSLLMFGGNGSSSMY